MHEFSEGGARFFADAGEVSAGMGVFYNPAMRENRDLSLVAVSMLAARRAPLRLCFPLAASAVRPLRVLEELDLPEGSRLLVGDASERAIDAARASLARNEHAAAFPGLELRCGSAQSLLAEAPFSDYVEIDPFGSPVPFLDAALQRVKRAAIVAVTATDTAPLCGTYPDTALRRYGAFTKRSPLMHEHAVRILAHVVERAAARYDREAKLLFAYAREHYVKLFFELETSRSRATRLVRAAEYWTIDAAGYPTARSSLEDGRRSDAIGPLSAQPLWDARFLDAADAIRDRLSDDLRADLDAIRTESRIDGPAIDLHRLASELGLASVPRTAAVLERLGEAQACRTLFCETAIRTSATRARIVAAVRGDAA